MPRKKRTTKASAKTIILDPEEKEKHDRIDALYDNWKSAVAAKRTMLVQYFEELKQQKLADIDRLMVQMDPEILNMTVKQFLEAHGAGEPDNEKKKPTKQAENNKEEQPAVTSMTNGIVDEVEQQLKELIDIPDSSGVSGSETQDKKTKRKRKPPKTASKRTARKAKKPDASLLETPCSSMSTTAEKFQDTPFVIPQQSRIRRAQTSADKTPMNRKPANLDEIKTLLTTPYTWLSERGSPVALVMPENPALRREIEQKMREITNLQWQAINSKQTE